MQYKNSSISIARAEAGPASPNDATLDKLNTHRVAKGKARKKKKQYCEDIISIAAAINEKSPGI